MLVVHPAFYRPFYVLRRGPQGRFRSYELLNRTVSCELVRDFVSSYPSMSREKIRFYCVPGRDIIERLLALSYQWRGCCSLKSFQSRMTIRVNGAWVEILVRELIHKPTNRSLDAYKIFLGDLGLR